MERIPGGVATRPGEEVLDNRWAAGGVGCKIARCRNFTRVGADIRLTHHQGMRTSAGRTVIVVIPTRSRGTVAVVTLIMSETRNVWIRIE